MTVPTGCPRLESRSARAESKRMCLLGVLGEFEEEGWGQCAEQAGAYIRLEEENIAEEKQGGPPSLPACDPRFPQPSISAVPKSSSDRECVHCLWSRSITRTWVA